MSDKKFLDSIAILAFVVALLTFFSGIPIDALPFSNLFEEEYAVVTFFATMIELTIASLTSFLGIIIDEKEEHFHD